MLSEFEKANMKIYYDSDCQLCRKIVYWLRNNFLTPETQVIPAQNENDIEEEMKKYNSWIVEDYNGKRYYKFDALIYMFPFLGKIPFIKSIGLYLYEFIANNRCNRKTCYENKKLL